MNNSTDSALQESRSEKGIKFTFVVTGNREPVLQTSVAYP